MISGMKNTVGDAVAEDGGNTIKGGSKGGANSLSKPSSKVLRQDLIEAGVGVPDYPNAAHHTVAGSLPKAADARAILQ